MCCGYGSGPRRAERHDDEPWRIPDMTGHLVRRTSTNPLLPTEHFSGLNSQNALGQVRIGPPRGASDPFGPIVALSFNRDGFEVYVHKGGSTGVVPKIVDHNGHVLRPGYTYEMQPGQYLLIEGGTRLDFKSSTVDFAPLTDAAPPVAVPAAPPPVVSVPRVVAPREAPAPVLPAPEAQKADAAAIRREQVERERAAAEAADLDAVMDAALARVASPVVTQRVSGKAGVR